MTPQRSAAQSESYTLVVLGGTGGVPGGGAAYDVNDNGVVVGFSGGGGNLGFSWTPQSGIQPFGANDFPFFGYYPKQLGINRAGQVAGQGTQTACSALVVRGAGLWTQENGYMCLGGEDTSATARAINSSGVVVGLIRGNNITPFIWRPGAGMTYLPGFGTIRFGDAHDVNDDGVVVGNCAGGCGSVASAFLRSEISGLQILPKVHSNANHTALAINNAGAVAGWFQATATTPWGVFLWSPDTGLQDLGAPAGPVEFVDLNDRNDVVATIIADGLRVPYLYRNGLWTNVNDLRPAGSTFVLGPVTAINNNGWMVGIDNTSSTGWVMIPPGAPVATDDAIATDEDVPVTGQLLATDPDGDPLTYTIETNGTLGTATITNAATGAFTYTPNPDVFGTDVFTFKANDGTSDSNIATMTVEIRPVADAPVAWDGAFTIFEDTPLNATLTATDADGDPLTFTIVTNGSLGTAILTDATTGPFTYVPNADVFGTDSFTFKANDGALESNTATFTIVIHPVNDAPVAADSSLSVAAGGFAEGMLLASDVDSPSLLYSIATNGTKGTATITDAATGAYAYTANTGTSGTDTFTFKANDGALDSNVATVTVTIVTEPQSPIAVTGVVTTTAGTAFTGTLQALSPSGLPLTFTIVDDGIRGSAWVNDSASGAFVYVPTVGTWGYDFFTFVAWDAIGVSAITKQLVFIVADSPQWSGSTIRASVTTDGVQGNAAAEWSSLSADGRYVVFQSRADNLVAGDTNGSTDVFVRDRETGVIMRASVSTSGAQANGASNEPVLSADGRYVAFRSAATDLVPGDTNGVVDVFLHDRHTGETRRVNVASDGTQADANAFGVSLSADGRYVAFSSAATNLVRGDTNNTEDVFVHDRDTGQTTLVSIASDGAQGNNPSTSPAISADGRYVAFRSLATNLVDGDTNGLSDVFLHDRSTGVTTRISISNAGAQGNGFSAEPAISADGRHVAFRSFATNLVAGDTNGQADIFVRDRLAGTTRRVSVASDGTEGNGTALRATMSADGRYVGFYAFSSNLVPGDGNLAADVFVHDSLTGETRRVSVASNGTEADGESSSPSLSADGRFVAFASLATNLVSGDTNGVSDVFVVGGGDPTPPTVTSSFDQAPNEHGWHKADVLVTATAADAESGVVSIRCAVGEVEFTGVDSVSFSWGTEGDTSVTCVATNGAGVESEASISISLDKTPPAIDIVAPADTTYDLHQSVTAVFQCSDALSGLTSCQSTVPYNTPIDTATAGAKVFSVSATDVAGNPAERLVNYTVRKGVPAITVTGGTFVYNGAAHAATGFVTGVIGEALGVPSFTYNGSPTPPVAVGQYAVVATFAGSADYEPASDSSAVISIVKASTLTSLSSSPNPSSFAQAVVLTATVAAIPPGGSTPAGTVSFFDNGNLIGSVPLDAGGTATLSTSGMSAGTHTLTAIYDGSESFDGSSGDPVSHTVHEPSASTQTTLTSSPNPSALNQSVTLEATVAPLSGSGRPAGSVRFYDGDTLLGTATLSQTRGSMRARLTTSALPVGSHTLTAHYDGDGTFGSSTSAPVGHSVYEGTKPTETTTGVTSAPNPSAPGQTVTVTASVSAKGKAQPTGMVQFYVNGVAVGGPVATDANGQASMQIESLPVGFHTVAAQFLGTATFASSTGQTMQFVQ